MRTAVVLGSLIIAGLGGCISKSSDDVHIVDIHGLALDPSVPARLYVATHHGLFVGENDTSWSAVTKEPFDMMGFTMHPKDGRIMYASGHPSRVNQGWAVGVVKSTDAGRTWTTLSLRNEVDFHAMAVEPGSTPAGDIIYGFHGGKLLVSADGGKSWTNRPQSFQIAALAVASNGDVYAAADAGLQRTTRGGAGTWQTVAGERSVAVATREKMLVAYFTNGGLKKSQDEGRTWTTLNWTLPGDDYPWGIALGPTQIYVGTARGTIHKSSDAGASWLRVR